MVTVPKVFSPIFIVGHSRSGSTLLASVFSEHSNILALPETHFFAKTYSNNFLSRLRHRSSQKLLDYLYKNPRLVDVGLCRETLEKQPNIKRITTYQQLYQFFLSTALGRSNKGRILEKTPNHLEFVDIIFKFFPNARVICIIRDGRDAVNSLMKVPWTHSNQERHAAYWAWCVREARRLQSKYTASLFSTVRYEDLVSNSEITLKSLCAFIGEPFEAAMLKEKRSESTVPEWEKAWKEKSQAQFDSSYLYQWKKEKNGFLESAAYSQQFMVNELDLMGYEKINNTFSEPSIVKKIMWNTVSFQLFLRVTYLLRTHLFPRRSDYRSRITTPLKKD